MKEPSKPLQLMRGAIENHLTMLTLGAVVVGVSLRYYADPHGFSNGKDILKELGNFILITFVVAFIYENFVNYRYKHEFLSEIERILSERFNLPITKVYFQRPELNDKAQLISQAEHQIVEFGTALRTFTSYLQSNMSYHLADAKTGVYRELIERRLADGVDFYCCLLDPEIASLMEDIEPGIKNKINTSLVYLRKLEADFEKKRFKGKFYVCLYQFIPSYSAIIIDGGKINSGKLLFSPYIPKKENALVPAFYVESNKSSGLFNSYWKPVESVIHTCMNNRGEQNG